MNGARLTLLVAMLASSIAVAGGQGFSFTSCIPGTLAGFDCPDGCNCYGTGDQYNCATDTTIHGACYQSCTAPMFTINGYCDQPVAPVSPSGPTCTEVDDPIELSTQGGMVRRSDLSVPTPAGRLDFVRTLDTSRLSWMSLTPPWASRAKLFGEPTRLPFMDAPYWSLNWTALVWLEPGSNSVFVHSPDGRVQRFASAVCPAVLAPTSARFDDEFACTTSGLADGGTAIEYVLRRSDGSREHYGVAASATGPYFLTRMYATNNQLLASVNYGPPRDGTGATLSGCPDGGANNVPFIQSVSGNSTVVDFRYAMVDGGLVTDGGPSRLTCGLAGLWLSTPGGAANQVVAYGYGGGVAPLASVTLTSNSTASIEGYSTIPAEFRLDAGLLFAGYELAPDGGYIRDNYSIATQAAGFGAVSQQSERSATPG